MSSSGGTLSSMRPQPTDAAGYVKISKNLECRRHCEIA